MQAYKNQMHILFTMKIFSLYFYKSQKIKPLLEEISSKRN